MLDKPKPLRFRACADVWALYQQAKDARAQRFSTGETDEQDAAEPAITIRIPLLPEGEFEHEWYGTLIWTDAKFRQMQANFAAEVTGWCPMLNFDHNGVAGGGWLAGTKAAGWFDSLEIEPGVGLFALVSLTDCGEDAISSREYRYVSAEVAELWQRSTGEAYANVILGAALTNAPFHDTMPGLFSQPGIPVAHCFSASAAGRFWAVAGDLAGQPATRPAELSAKEGEPMSLLDKARKFFGLSAAATEDEVSAAMDGNEARANSSAAGVTQLATAMSLDMTQSPAVLELRRQLDEQRTQMEALRVERLQEAAIFAQREAAALIDRFVREGKITPAQRDLKDKDGNSPLLAFALSNPVAFEQVHSAARPQVDLAPRGTLREGGDGGADDFQSFVRSLMAATPGLEFTQAFERAATLRPELYDVYAASQTRGRKN